MDKNTTIGLILIFAILVIFSYINRPSQKEIEAAKHKRDSIALVEQQMAKEAELQQQSKKEKTNIVVEADTTKESTELKNLYGNFSVSAQGEEEFYTLENNLIKLTLSSKGGRVYSVELKNYKRYDSTALILIEGQRSEQNLSFFAQNRNIQTDKLYFKLLSPEKHLIVQGPEVPKGKEGRLKFNEEHPGQREEMILRLDAGNGHYIDYVYSIAYNSYDIGYEIRMHEMNNIINTNIGYLSFNFNFDVPRQEHASKFGEDRYTSIYFKYKDAEIDNLNLNKNDKKSLNTPIKWIGYKQLFFSTVLIAKDEFANAIVSTKKYDATSNYVSHFKSDIGFPFGSQESDAVYDMTFYFGPNHYQTLKEKKLKLEKMINLGWPIVRDVNKLLIIPVFNFLRSRISNFGIIILILTIMIRLIVAPFTYRSYVSQAKIRALKPEIDEINKKYSPEKAMERQQATMALYKRVGVNPMGGCLPMLFQFPVLVAMFYFFPGSIELRQQGFLWAHDLSTYDSILKLPFSIPFGYGDHVSLFTLLMTITTIIQTYLTNQTQDNSSMPGMKFMMYFMPIFFMFILNSYSAGLSYYYLLSNIFTIAQTYIIRKSISEEKVRAQLMANKKKPVKKKSGFQKRLEEMARQQQQMAKRK